MTTLTTEHLKLLFPDAPDGDVEDEFPFILDTLSKYDINTKYRIAAFLANVAKESGELVYVEEIADGWAYEGREDLGNIHKGDGPLFKGRGYIQITGRLNYGKVAEALGIDCVNDPMLLTEPQWAWASAGWYWTHGSSWGDLNAFADSEDFESTVLGVRGGPDPDRHHYWHTALAVLPDDISIDIAPANAMTTTEHPTMWMYIDEQGWLREWYSRKYIRAKEKGTKFRTDGEGWLFVPDFKGLIKPKWSWPEANVEPIPGSAWYVERHPTRYFWRPDVESWARYLVDNYNVWCNTYWEHPEKYGFEPSEADPAWLVQNTSLDVWAKEGRGYGLDKTLGDTIHTLLFNYEGLPDIDWIIWQGWMWTAAGGWEWFSNDTSDADMGHWKHIHVTYK